MIRLPDVDLALSQLVDAQLYGHLMHMPFEVREQWHDQVSSGVARLRTISRGFRRMLATTQQLYAAATSGGGSRA